MTKIFFSYTHKDEELRNRLEVSLKMMERQGLIEPWHDRRIVAGSEVDDEIDQNLEQADIILLLVSPDFIASDYCYKREMARALERNETGEARVIPVILRRCDWHHAPFGKLLATPPDGKPVRSYADLDDGFQEVTDAIRKAVQTVIPSKRTAASMAAPVKPATAVVAPQRGPRSSNLALPKSFSDRDRDRFLDETFDYLRGFFENSLDELQNRNTGIEANFRENSTDQFTVTIYQNGTEVTRCTIAMGGDFGKGITFSYGTRGNGINEQLRVESDDQGMFLKSMGMATWSSKREEKLSQAGSAELFWGMLIGQLQSQR